MGKVPVRDLWNKALQDSLAYWKAHPSSEEELQAVAKQAKDSFDAAVDREITPHTIGAGLGRALLRFQLVEKFRAHVPNILSNAMQQLEKRGVVELPKEPPYEDYFAACEADVMQGAIAELQKNALIPASFQWDPVTAAAARALQLEADKRHRQDVEEQVKQQRDELERDVNKRRREEREAEINAARLKANAAEHGLGQKFVCQKEEGGAHTDNISDSERKGLKNGELSELVSDDARAKLKLSYDLGQRLNLKYNGEGVNVTNSQSEGISAGESPDLVSGDARAKLKLSYAAGQLNLSYHTEGLTSLVSGIAAAECIPHGAGESPIMVSREASGKLQLSYGTQRLQLSYPSVVSSDTGGKLQLSYGTQKLNLSYSGV